MCEVSLGYIARSCLKAKPTNQKHISQPDASIDPYTGFLSLDRWQVM
jgi:hypothetical protein